MIESLLPTMEEDGTVNEVKKRFIYIGESYEIYKDNCYIGLAQTTDTVQIQDDYSEDDTSSDVGDENSQKSFEVKTINEWHNKEVQNSETEEHDGQIISTVDKLNNVISLSASPFSHVATEAWKKDICCFFSLSPFYLQESSFFSVQYKSAGESDSHIVLVPYSLISGISENQQKAEKIMETVASYKEIPSKSLEPIDSSNIYSILFDNIYSTKFIIQCLLCEGTEFPPGYYIPVLVIPFGAQGWAGPQLYRLLSIR